MKVRILKSFSRDQVGRKSFIFVHKGIFYQNTDSLREKKKVSSNLEKQNNQECFKQKS